MNGEEAENISARPINCVSIQKAHPPQSQYQTVWRGPPVHGLIHADERLLGVGDAGLAVAVLEPLAKSIRASSPFTASRSSIAEK